MNIKRGEKQRFGFNNNNNNEKKNPTEQLPVLRKVQVINQ